ncbi:MAG TPA: YbaY family lipoprotein [Leptolyngbyaceae cyanobacterium M33_DOE_097]|uniref:Lipo-like protein n=1 Tax=Oscillatoriales cyanobacterium SpSt-418 TaxID=2282169 RepID=A0A7C3KE60_9CYAN|nr:YbaY family lipoprotein [Leptolyngbyaceae cyanobacterium M33_DOE_097]
MNSASATVTGTVSYLQRIAMPPDATLEVRLLDVSRQDAPAEVLASETISFGGRQVPIPFALTYNPDKIQENHTYTVDARILVDGKLRFISDTVNQVITRDNPTTIEIIVKPVK